MFLIRSRLMSKDSVKISFDTESVSLDMSLSFDSVKLSFDSVKLSFDFVSFNSIDSVRYYMAATPVDSVAVDSFLAGADSSVTRVNLA
jgi:hypothetical protein